METALTVIALTDMSLAQLVAAHNLLAERPVKALPSKAKALERIEALAAERGGGLHFAVDGEGAVELVHDADGQPDLSQPEDNGGGGAGGEEGGEPEQPAAEVAFVKASKEELGAMSTADRAAYRKARRKAARALRKARQGA